MGLSMQRVLENPASDFPPPSAELVLFRVHVEALISVLGHRKATRYLRTMTDALANEDNFASVFQIRPTAQHVASRQARKQAAMLFEMYLPLWLARVPRE